MKTYGIVSGYFAPIHLGHIQYIQSANQRCDKLIVIVNNDLQTKLKGSVPFLDENHRAAIVNEIKGVDEVMISIDEDSSVCRSIKCIYKKNKSPDNVFSFFNSGDRPPENFNSVESKLCEKLGIDNVYIELPKICSSSAIMEKICDQRNKKDGSK